MRTTAIITFVCCILSVCACKKKETTSPDVSKVKMVITSPAEGQIFHNGDSVHVMATVSYEGILHGYELKVSDTATGGVVFDFAEHVHKDSFVISQSFMVSGTQPFVLKLVLRTEIDHAGSDTEVFVYSLYQPL